MTQAGDASFSYDARNRNSGVETHGHDAGGANYLYNALGERVSKETSGKDHAFSSGNTHFIYDRQGRLIAEADSFGGVGREYIYLDDLTVAMADGNDLYFIHADHLGAPQKMTDEKGKVAWERLAAPFGDTLDIKAKGKAALNLRFPGQYHDDESGLDYNYFRSYNPELGRYTQSDPIGLLGGIPLLCH